jgi:hypothetical protein
VVAREYVLSVNRYEAGHSWPLFRLVGFSNRTYPDFLDGFSPGFRNLIFRHLLVLIYAFEGFLILGGVLLLRTEIYRFGLSALGITAAIHVGPLALEDFMRRKGKWYLLPILILVLVVIFLAALGIYHLLYYLPEESRGWLSIGESS